MPLSELYRVAKAKIEATQQKTTTYSNHDDDVNVSFLPHNEFVELVMENGQIMMQNQSNKNQKTPFSTKFQFHTQRDNKDTTSNPTTSKTAKYGAMDSIFTDIELSVPSPQINLGHHDDDDDMVPWLTYPVADNLHQDYCSNLLPELSGVTANHPSNNSCASIHKRESSTDTVTPPHNVQVGSSQQGTTASKLYPWSLQQEQPSIPSLKSGVSDLTSTNTPLLKNTNSGLLNFSHFLRPAANAVDGVGTSSSAVDKIGDKDKRSSLHYSSLQEEMGFHRQPTLLSANENSTTKPLESHSTENFDAIFHEEAVKKESPNKDVIQCEKTVEPVVASSSVCSANSTERVSNDPTSNLKRKCRDSEESEWQSDDVDEELVGVKRGSFSRGGTGSKRSRAAEVHNLSERRRRDRINEKMRALQELIPNCNKVDKASMLDEAIEYLKTLQLQVQIMSMGAGLYMPHMMLPPGMQHVHMPHFSPLGVGMGMGFGMGMVDMNGGSRGYPMIQVPPMQGVHYPSPPFSGPTTFQGMPGSNRQVFGHPGQVLPMTVSGSPLVPLPVQPPENITIGLKSKDIIQNAGSQVMQNGEASSSMNQTST